MLHLSHFMTSKTANIMLSTGVRLKILMGQEGAASLGQLGPSNLFPDKRTEFFSYGYHEEVSCQKGGRLSGSSLNSASI